MALELTELEESIVAFCRERNRLPELCVLVAGSTGAGEPPEHWAPKPEVLALAAHIHTSALLDACEAIQSACMNGELPDVCEEAIVAIKSRRWSL